MVNKKYQLIEIINKTTAYLKNKGFEKPRLEAELLVAHVLNLNRVQLYLSFEKLLQRHEIERIRTLLQRRIKHEPLQYILGETEFYSLKFKVNRTALIPRPETEILIETVIDNCNNYSANCKLINILDIGTGCGNIAITLAKNLKHCQVKSIDINSDTIKLAQENAEFHQMTNKIDFICQDIFKKLPDKFQQFDVIVSNPPYISSQMLTELPLEVKNYEPYVALNGGGNGFKFYFRIVEISKKILASNGFVAVEIGAYQGKDVFKIFSETGFFRKIEIIKDLNKRNRVVLARA